MESSLRIVFSGEVIEGFDPEKVKLSASARLNASPSQIEQVFSGRPAVLKKGLNAESGARYLALLAHIGMLARLENETPDVEPTSVPQPAPEAAPAQASSAHFVAAGGDTVEALPTEDEAHQEESPRTKEGETQKPSDSGLVSPSDIQSSTAEPETLPEVVCSECTERQPLTQFCRRCGSEIEVARLQPASAPLHRSSTQPTPETHLMPISEEDLGPRTVFAAADPQTVFSPVDDDGPRTQMPKRRHSHHRHSRKKSAVWPQNALLGVVIASIAYTLYWVVTHY